MVQSSETRINHNECVVQQPQRFYWYFEMGARSFVNLVCPILSVSVPMWWECVTLHIDHIMDDDKLYVSSTTEFAPKKEWKNWWFRCVFSYLKLIKTCSFSQLICTHTAQFISIHSIYIWAQIKNKYLKIEQNEIKIQHTHSTKWNKTRRKKPQQQQQPK